MYIIFYIPTYTLIKIIFFIIKHIYYTIIINYVLRVLNFYCAFTYYTHYIDIDIICI